eukprot:scaffold147606_cov13-Tisochrysis_lutea.AAC.1
MASSPSLNSFQTCQTCPVLGKVWKWLDAHRVSLHSFARLSDPHPAALITCTPTRLLSNHMPSSGCA